MDRLIQRSFILDYTLQSMQLQVDDTKASLAALPDTPLTAEDSAATQPAADPVPTESESSAKKRKRGPESDAPQPKKQKTSAPTSATKKKSKAK